MAEESASVETGFLHTAAPEQPSAPEAAVPESRTRGMLRDAIQKVMAEIAHHEEQARKHVQQADELRRDLRETFALMAPERGEAAKAMHFAGKPDEAARTREQADDRPTRGGSKKKMPGKKSK